MSVLWKDLSNHRQGFDYEQVEEWRSAPAGTQAGDVIKVRVSVHHDTSHAFQSSAKVEVLAPKRSYEWRLVETYHSDQWAGLTKAGATVQTGTAGIEKAVKVLRKRAMLLLEAEPLEA